MFYIWTTPANLKIELKPSMSEIRNYLVANPIQNGGEEGEKRSIRILISFDYRSKRDIGSRGEKFASRCDDLSKFIGCATQLGK